jgi:hypothetical protein
MISLIFFGAINTRFNGLFLNPHTNLWDSGEAQRRRARREFCLITTVILFSELQICSVSNFFFDFAFSSTRERPVGCYIDFSGFSTSRVLLAQDQVF